MKVPKNRNQEYNAEANKACLEHPSTSSPPCKKDFSASETTTTVPDENQEALIEAAQAPLDPSADEPEPEDTGAFDMSSVCIALANNGLDEQRMQRLPEGFFGLLNQTL